MVRLVLFVRPLVYIDMFVSLRDYILQSKKVSPSGKFIHVSMQGKKGCEREDFFLLSNLV